MQLQREMKMKTTTERNNFFEGETAHLFNQAVTVVLVDGFFVTVRCGENEDATLHFLELEDACIEYFVKGLRS
jgi:hypothetical protein